jgi:SAM-dependent methyltransferase
VPPGRSLVDLGTKYGTLGAYVAARLGLEDVIGIDRFEDALEIAAGEGVRTILADLATDLPLPIDASSAAVVTSFGAIEHLPWFDELLLEAHRLLVPNGWLLLSTPNLASYLNRAALLAGYQPRDVEVARRFTPGILPSYRTHATRKPLGHPHVATLRAMTELLTMTGFDVVSVHGFGPPGPRAQRVLDALFSRFPSLARRVLILSRKKAPPERA